MTIKLILSMAM